MADKFRQASALLLELKPLLKEGKLKKALAILHKSLATYVKIMPKLLKGEQGDYHKLLDKAVYLFNFNQRFRKIKERGLTYAHGEEARLLEQIKDILDKYDDFIAKEKQAKKAKAAAKKKDILAKGLEFLKDGAAKKAYILFRKEAKEHSGDADFIIKMGRILYNNGRVEDSAEIFIMAEDQKEEDVAFLNMLATVMRKLRKHDRAQEYYNKAMAASPNDEGLMYNAARNLIEWRKWDPAYDILKKAIEMNPDFEHARKTIRAVEKKLFGKVYTKLQP